MLLTESILNLLKIFKDRTFIIVDLFRNFIRKVIIEENVLQRFHSRWYSSVSCHFTITWMLVNCVNSYFALSEIFVRESDLWSMIKKYFER